MAQGPLTATVAAFGSTRELMALDATGNLATENGGTRQTYDITAAAVIKATPGRLRRIVVQVAGSAGSWTFNDCATVAAAAASNQIATLAYNATGLVAGMPVTFDWPCAVGIVVSVVPSAGSPVLAVSWD
jgi:phage terminase large subunit-like protein